MLPIVFSTTMNNMNWSIGLEVTLSVLGFTNINTPTIGTMIYWANQHTAMVAGIWWWIVFPVALIVHDVHRAVPAGGVDERVYRPAQPPAPHGRWRPDGRDQPRCQRKPAPAPRPTGARGPDLRAYYQMHYFGIAREVRAVDDITLHDPGATRSTASPANRAAARPR